MPKIQVDYINHMGSDIDVVNAARVSFGKEKSAIDDKDIKLINYLAKHKHFTPFEHCTLSIKIKCPLYIRSQIHRHRTFSFNEVSRRYTSENIEFYEPEVYRKQHQSSKQCSAENMSDYDNKEIKYAVKNLHLEALKLYNHLIDNKGVARELARGILPQNLMTEFWMTGNLRNWVHFLGLRADNHAQLEVQEVAKPILDIIKKEFPVAGAALFKHTLNLTI